MAVVMLAFAGGYDQTRCVCFLRVAVVMLAFAGGLPAVPAPIPQWPLT